MVCEPIDMYKSITNAEMFDETTLQINSSLWRDVSFKEMIYYV